MLICERGKRSKQIIMHPRNKYAEANPDFGLLSSLYPDLKQYVSFSSNGRAKIIWTDYNATRQLTKVLLHHDFGILNWWIPDGHLCPTVPNRANYIHWIQDLLCSFPSPWHGDDEPQQIFGLDVGTGANCIYPLLGATIHGWHFVATDITAVALEWAQKNIEQNMHLSNLIEIRNAGGDVQFAAILEGGNGGEFGSREYNDNSSFSNTTSTEGEINEVSSEPLCLDYEAANARDVSLTHHQKLCSIAQENEQDLTVDSSEFIKDKKYRGPPILSGVVKEKERFDFCMCNPPFFESIEEGGANPRTACGGTPYEMVCPGGEEGFIMRMIEDSVKLRGRIHWYTTMVGKKINLKVLMPKLREVGVTVLRTTEFVQGRTCRWGLAWSFTPSLRKPTFRPPMDRTSMSFTMEGRPHLLQAKGVLEALAKHFEESGATSTIDVSSFTITSSLSIQAPEREDMESQPLKRRRETESFENHCLQYTTTVFQQAPGSLIVKASLVPSKGSASSALFYTIFESGEEKVKAQFHVKSSKKSNAR